MKAYKYFGRPYAKSVNHNPRNKNTVGDLRIGWTIYDIDDDRYYYVRSIDRSDYAGVLTVHAYRPSVNGEVEVELSATALRDADCYRFFAYYRDSFSSTPVKPWLNRK